MSVNPPSLAVFGRRVGYLFIKSGSVLLWIVLDAFSLEMLFLLPVLLPDHSVFVNINVFFLPNEDNAIYLIIRPNSLCLQRL